MCQSLCDKFADCDTVLASCLHSNLHLYLYTGWIKKTVHVFKQSDADPVHSNVSKGVLVLSLLKWLSNLKKFEAVIDYHPEAKTHLGYIDATYDKIIKYSH